MKITSKHKTKNISNPGNFGQKAYRIQKFWPSLTLATEPLQSPVFQAHYLNENSKSISKCSKSWVRIYFFGKFMEIPQFLELISNQLLEVPVKKRSKKNELGIQLCRHHIQVTRQIHRLKTKHTLQRGPWVAWQQVA